MYELSVTGHFASAHSLRGYKGPCEAVHGHTWKVEVTLESDQTNEIGLVMDFREVKDQLKDLLSRLDHVHLNELPAFQNVNPSTENIARYIYQEFSPRCRPHRVKTVRVWESDTASVTYYE